MLINQTLINKVNCMSSIRSVKEEAMRNLFVRQIKQKQWQL